MKHFILEKAEQTGIKIIDRESGRFLLWTGITYDEVRRIFLAAIRVPFPKSTIEDVGKYFHIVHILVRPEDKAFDFSKNIVWKTRLDSLDRFQKANVGAYTRVRRGRMERVKGYAKVGARKAIMIGLVAIMATLFGVSPLIAQTKYAEEGTPTQMSLIDIKTKTPGGKVVTLAHPGFDTIGNYNQGQFDPNRNEGFIKLGTPELGANPKATDWKYFRENTSGIPWDKACEWRSPFEKMQ
jgi:hypothetical protein